MSNRNQQVRSRGIGAPLRVRRLGTFHGLAALVALGLLAGCSTNGYTRIRPTEIRQAPEDLPEDRLLDVGVAVSDVAKLSKSKMKKEGTHPDIRKSERHYVPYHLKNTLQQSGHWGRVQVVPREDDDVDLRVTSELVRSNGEKMQIKVQAADASGRVWLTRKYLAKAKQKDYEDTVPGEHEAFQDLYNTIVNDLSAFKRSLTPDQIEEIRTVSKLRFAREYAPAAFATYLGVRRDGRIVILRLPAADDPLMARIEKIHEREAMFVELLNQYYEGFYNQMWDAYENWRKYNLVELEALREVRRDAMIRIAAGSLMIAAAIGTGVSDTSGMEVLTGVLAAGGGAIIISGVDISKQAEIHAAAIEELSESFGSEMQPTVIELEGRQHELTGTASEQFQRLKELLHRIYLEETGFDSDLALRPVEIEED